MSGTVRITVDLTPEQYARLQQLEASTGAESKASIVRRAIRLADFIVAKRAEGFEFHCTKDGEREQLVLLDWD